MSRDARYRALIDTRRWRRVRGVQLSTEPLCRHCRERGVTRAATEVHHITPLESIADDRRRARLAYAPDNLVSLCHDCHVAVHMAMGKGTKAERRERAQGEASLFAEQWFGGDPGPDF